MGVAKILKGSLQFNGNLTLAVIKGYLLTKCNGWKTFYLLEGILINTLK